MTPFFDPAIVYLLEKGGVFALPSLRGGGEYGKDWHEAGRGSHKQNSIDDFIAAAQFLIGEQYTTSGKLAIMGGSNGGLLVGAAMAQRPDLFRVAILQAPLLDMLRYQNFTIGQAWQQEYGSSADSLHFATLLGYSPLHNLRRGVSYPATLVITGDNDDRVPPLHGCKFVATLQEQNAGPYPVLLYTEKQAGHSGALTYQKTIDQKVLKYTFIFYHLGISP